MSFSKRIVRCSRGRWSRRGGLVVSRRAWRGVNFFVEPGAFFTQATLSHAEMRPARFVVDPRLLASHLPGLAIQGSAATNASCPRYASRNAYLPYIMHGCDRFDLSPRSNTQSTYCKFQVNRAGRRQIESFALCACRRHLRIISTL